MVVYLILFHKGPDQLFRLIDALYDKGVHFVLHICKNYADYDSLYERAQAYGNISFCKRERGTWASYYLAKASYNGMRAALELPFDFSHIVLLSAQDYPLRPSCSIKEHLAANRGTTFMKAVRCAPELNGNGEYFHPVKTRWTSHDETGRYKYYNFKLIRNSYFRLHNELDMSGGFMARLRNNVRRMLCRLVPIRSFIDGLVPYFGPQWCVFAREHCQYVVDRYPEGGSFHCYMKKVFCPDEMFFHTALMNSEHVGAVVNECLHYIVWSDCNHPDVFTEEHFGELKTAATDKLFARKFDMSADEKILTRIDNELLQSSRVNC